MGCGSNRPGQQTRFIRVALIGQRQAGKTALISSFLEQRFEAAYESEKSPSIAVKTYYCGDTVTTLEVWELRESTYLPTGTSHAVVAVDCTQPISLIQDQVTQLKTVHGFSNFAVAVTKADLLPDGQAEDFLADLRKTLDLPDNIRIHLTSAQLGTGVRELFLASLRPSPLTQSGTTGSEAL